MQTTAQAIQVPRRGRARWLFLAILLQVAFVYALVEGLDIKVAPIKIPDPFHVTIDKGPKPATPPPPRGDWAEPQVDRVGPPDFVTDRGDDGGGITLNPGRSDTAAPTDHGPITIAATHTIPPYPPIEARLGHEGTVVLRLMIALDGRVADAVVVRSSGYERLDLAAREWVMAHWRYQPAARGGAAVPGATTVGVEFKLRG